MIDDNESNQINSNQVAEFLKSHPDFFQQYPNVLASMDLEHQAKGAVSLIERQVTLLREHHQTTRLRLVELSNIAKTNEALLNRIRSLSIAAASESTPKNILGALSKVIIEEFRLDAVYLVVERKAWPMYSENVITVTAEDITNLSHAIYDLPTFVGRPSEKIREIALKGKEETTASVTMACFKYKGLNSYMVVGSRDENHFTNEMSTDFVSYIARFLEAILNRENV